MRMRKRSGEDSEDLVELICTRMFFSDFVVRGPDILKPKGKRIQIADLLVPFGDKLITFQVKSKFQPVKASEKTEVDFQRLTSSVNEAVEQVTTIKRALQNDWLKGMKTTRGLEIEIDSSQVTDVIGVVVLDLVGEEELARDEQTQLFASFTWKDELPVHVFFAHEFFAISKELDTLPDFLEFLELIRALYSQNLLVVPPTTLDLLAYYKKFPEQIENAIEDGTRIMIEDGVWEAYQEHHADAIKERDRLNQPSLLIDTVIAQLHTSVGYYAVPEDQDLAKMPGQGTVEGYLSAAREIASLSRLERRHLGERMERCLLDAVDREHAYSVVRLEDQQTGYLVLAKSGNRGERQSFLHRLAAMAYCQFDLTKIIGIGTEPMSGEGRSFDVVGFSDQEFENSKELAEAAKSFFGDPYSAKGSEYTSG